MLKVRPVERPIFVTARIAMKPTTPVRPSMIGLLSGWRVSLRTVGTIPSRVMARSRITPTCWSMESIVPKIMMGRKLREPLNASKSVTDVRMRYLIPT